MGQVLSPEFSVPVDGAALRGERRDGAGTPLVLIHGFGGSRRDWDPVVTALCAQRPLIAYDQRGFGRSRADETPYSHSGDLLALLDALGIARADVCGLSLGGSTALDFALDHPDRVRRLVLVSPLMTGWTWSADWIDRWKTIGRAARAGDMAQARALWWAHPLFDSLRDLPAAATMRAGIAAFEGGQWVMDPQLPALPATARLCDLAAPTLLVTGGRDTEDFRAIARTLDSGATGIVRIDHPDAGHMLNLEMPEALAAGIEAFLAA